jgi:phage shock protein PspC (stress-responsive transcriptional regulator)
VNEIRKFRRSRTDKKLAGIIGGLADYFEVDSTLLRVMYILAGMWAVPFALISYIIVWILTPSE